MAAGIKSGTALERMARSVGVVVRIAFSGIVFGAVLVVIYLGWRSFLPANPAVPRTRFLPGSGPVGSKPTGDFGAGAKLWPRFPSAVRLTTEKMVVNGISCLVEHWETSSAGREVLDYYRWQMVTRGWRESTESTYNLRPEGRIAADSAGSLQDSNYIEQYRRVMDTRLVLNRQGRTIQIIIEPTGRMIQPTSVAIIAFDTPSADGLAEALATAFSTREDRKDSRKGVDVVDSIGGQRYHTVMSQSAKPMELAFKSELSKAQTQGWKPAFSSAPKSDEKGRFVMLVNGNSSAYLSAVPGRKGEGALVTFTEVKPEAQPAK